MIEARPAGITPEVWADVVFGALDAEGAAEYLGSSKDQFAKIAPEIPRVRVGKSFRYFRSDLIGYLYARREENLTATPDGNPMTTDGNKQQFKPGRKPGNERTKRLI